MTDTITLKQAVGIILEGFTLPDAARKILETAYFAEAALAQQAEPNAGWVTAADEEMVGAHLGVANLSDSYESAKSKLSQLIDWHVAVATDPAVNGVLSLQPVAQQAEQVPDGYQLVPCYETADMQIAFYSKVTVMPQGHILNFSEGYKAMLAAAPKGGV